MKSRSLNNTACIKLFTGIILISYVLYRIYKCSVIASQLNIISFMAVCIAIVIVGFGSATVYEYFIGKSENRQVKNAIIRQMIEGLLIVILIAIICSIINII